MSRDPPPLQSTVVHHFVHAYPGSPADATPAPQNRKAATHHELDPPHRALNESTTTHSNLHRQDPSQLHPRRRRGERHTRLRVDMRVISERLMIACMATAWIPVMVRDDTEGPIRLGHRLVDLYLEFVGLRLRPNSVLAIAFDLKVFFTVISKDPVDVVSVDIFDFIAEQRRPRSGTNVVRISDRESGLSARTIHRRLSSVHGFYEYLLVRGDVGVRHNPVPRRSQTRSAGPRPIGLIRLPRTVPRIVDTSTIERLFAATRRRRDRAMFEAMLFGGLRRCEVLGLQLNDIRPGEHRLFIANGKGGHQRIVPVAQRFFASLADYFAVERPPTMSTSVFVVMQGPNIGKALSAAGLDIVLEGACHRAGVGRVSCHQLRHTCMTRLREAGMSLEAIQAQAGQRLLETTRMYVHLSDRWLNEEYLAAMARIDADLKNGGSDV